jgi:hypothetical protein
MDLDQGRYSNAPLSQKVVHHKSGDNCKNFRFFCLPPLVCICKSGAGNGFPCFSVLSQQKLNNRTFKSILFYQNNHYFAKQVEF